MLSYMYHILELSKNLAYRCKVDFSAGGGQKV